MTRGTATGNIVANHNVDVVITGHIGRHASAVLRDAAVKIFTEASGTVREAIEAFKAGKLTELLEK